ncbi:MAG TPA: flagellar hook-associated protein FlgK [Bacteroidetes bacterium]|nr:flagellar hook-associated protein FlgK [Bacteroidota bacterium]HIL57451.1 flagellar hook-associated protein FlgK [Rhodothermales bacterium]
MSLSNLYLTGRRGLLAAQAGTNVAGQNLANVETPGYSRRTLRLSTDPIPRGGIVFHGVAPGAGGGVGVTSLDRLRSAIMDDAVRDARAGEGGADESARLLASFEARLAPDSGGGLLGALDSFYASWSDVAAAPTDSGRRDVLLASARAMVQAVQTASGRMDAVAASTQGELQTAVGEVNDLLSEIASLNAQARAAHATGAEAHDVLDQRDQLLDQLSSFVPAQVRPQDDGTVTVTVAGMIGVQGETSEAFELRLPPETDQPQVFAAGARHPLRLDALAGGRVGAQLGLLNDAIPAARESLDALVAEVVGSVNAAHVQGEGLDGQTGRTFFDPTGTNADSFALSADLTSGDAIAAGTAGAGPGDAAVANAIVDGSASATATLTDLLTDIGTRTQNASAAAEANAAVAAHTEALRDGISSVSTDEEMTNLIRYQQAYAASARVIETANTLFDSLLSI